jgi:hypothetical protein
LIDNTRTNWKAHMKTLTRLLVTAAAAALFAPAQPALAASASMGTDNAGSVYVEYFADPQQTNRVTISSCGANCLHIEDAGASIAAGWGWLQSYGCKNPESPGINTGVAGNLTAHCSHPSRIDYLVIGLDDRNDTLTIDSSVPGNLIAYANGGPGNDVLSGGPTIDNLYGGEDHDQLFGGGGCDNLQGQNGNDLLDGGPAPDSMDGGSGSDIADYSRRTVPLFVSLDLARSGNLGPCNGSPFGNDGGHGEGDNVDPNIETIWGGSANDALFGDGGANVLFGALGDDRLDGGRGADRIIGDGGVDTADYSGRTARVIVALDGVADDGELGERDFVEQVENVNAGSGDDLLTGDGKGNRLSGGSGRDTLDGGSGWDRLEGGDDADQIRAADSDADTVDCGAGVDSASVDTLDAVSACENLSWSPIRLELPP